MKLTHLLPVLGATAALLLPTGHAFTVLTGLVGNDLTDIGDNGVEGSYNPPGTLAGFDAEFFADREAGFSGFPGSVSGELAFNVFDNTVGGGQAKWCCGDSAPPATVGAMNFTSITRHIQLTGFTLTSSNDSSQRDPRNWQIQGSLDTTTGLDGTWTTIYGHAAGSDFGAARNQTLLYSPANGDTFLTTDGFTAFRLQVNATGGGTSGAWLALGELEFFGVGVPSGGSTLPMLLSGVAGLIVLRSKRRK